MLPLLLNRFQPEERLNLLLWRERMIHGLLAFCTAIPILEIVAIFTAFVYQTALFFQDVQVWQFLTDSEWTPLLATRNFGIGVLISATLLISAIALLVAIPLGKLAAIYLSEFTVSLARGILKLILEALAEVPTTDITLDIYQQRSFGFRLPL